MIHTLHEMMWLKSLLLELRFNVVCLMPIYCDNKATIYIAGNPIFHERTKRIEMDYYFICDVVF